MSLIKCWCTVKELGHFGGDYTAIFRGNLKVKVKKLRRADNEEESERGITFMCVSACLCACVPEPVDACVLLL